jgi:hypothetical protein
MKVVLPIKVSSSANAPGTVIDRQWESALTCSLLVGPTLL